MIYEIQYEFLDGDSKTMEMPFETEEHAAQWAIQPRILRFQHPDGKTFEIRPPHVISKITVTKTDKVGPKIIIPNGQLTN